MPTDIATRLREADNLRAILFANLKAKLPELQKLLASAEGHWGIEDTVYRFYHGSFKVYTQAQMMTTAIVAALQSLLPVRELDTDFLEIIKEGTGKTFELEHNREWAKHTRPMIEALFHAHYFLKMACRYGEELAEQPQMLPSGWAAFLYLYRLR